MAKRIGFMFAGQGAQKPGMGRDLYDASAAAKAVFETADRVLGWRVSELCFDGTDEQLTASANCQPAIYVVSLACAAAFAERGGPGPVVTGGLSLGELSAVTAAGALDLEQGVRLVARRGALMDEACRASEGTMAAVLADDVALIEGVCASCGVDAANYNCPGQVVISGHRTAMDEAVRALSDAGVKRIVPLNVAGAYHSRLMQPAADAFAAVLQDVNWEEPACPVAQNVTGTLVSDSREVAENLRRQVTGSVRWDACVRAMLDAGVEALVELGPGRVLSGFLRRIDRRFPTVSVGGFEDVDKALAAL